MRSKLLQDLYLLHKHITSAISATSAINNTKNFFLKRQEKPKQSVRHGWLWDIQEEWPQTQRAGPCQPGSSEGSTMIYPMQI